MANRYIGVTIGPIIETLANTKSTKAIWGASYLFSYLMKDITKSFRNERNFIMPYVDDNSIYDKPSDLGLFPDRLIFKSQEGDYSKLQTVIEESIENLSLNISEVINKSYDDVVSYLKDYLNIKSVELELQDKDNPILIINNHLDHMELHKNFSSKHKKNSYLQEYFENAVLKENSILKTAAYGKAQATIKSIQNIAIADLAKNSYEDIDYKKIKEELKLKDYKFKSILKYIAVVQSDGDNISKIIEKLQKEEQYQDFSKLLFNYVSEANNVIKEFGGQVIYGGGDDLLFFAPILTENSNILKLCEDLNGLFIQKYTAFLNKYNLKLEGEKPSISFGISVNYVKYPMKDMLKEAASLLFEEAKTTKNALALRITKHSGQYFGFVKERNSKTYKKLLELVNHYSLLESKKDKNSLGLLNSLVYKIDSEDYILKNIMHSEDSLKNYFANSLNEDIHKSEKIQSFLKDLAVLIVDVNAEEKDKNKVLETVYFYLRTLKFLGDEGEKDE